MSAYGLSLGRLNLHLSTDTSRLSTGFMTFRNEMRKTKAAAQGIGGSIGGIGTKLKELNDTALRVGRTMSLSLSVPLAIIGSQALKTAGEFQLGMNRVRALTEATAAQFHALTQQALFLGRTTQFSARQAASAMGFLAMAGQRTGQILGSVPSVLQLAASALIDMGTAADIVTNIMAGFGISVKDLPNAVDILVKAFTSANTNLVQLGHAMKYVGPVAKAVGFDFKETVAAVSLLGNAGIQASLAGTSLRGAILRVTKPTGEAADAIEALGIKVKTSDGRLKGLIDILEEFEIAIARAGGETKVAGEIMQILGLRAGPGVLALLSQGSKRVRELAAEFQNVGGYAKKVANVQLQGYAGALKRIISTTEGVGIAIGEVMIPAFEKISDVLVKFNNYIINLGPGARGLIVALMGFSAVIGPLVLITALIIKLLNPMNLLILTAYVFAFAAIFVWQNWEKLGPAFEELFKGIRDDLQKLEEKRIKFDWLKELETGDPSLIIAGLTLGLGWLYGKLKKILAPLRSVSLALLGMRIRLPGLIGLVALLAEGGVYLYKNWSDVKNLFKNLPADMKLFIDNMSMDVVKKSWDDFVKTIRSGLDYLEKLRGKKFEFKFLGLKENLSLDVVKKSWDDFVKTIRNGLDKIIKGLKIFEDSMSWNVVKQSWEDFKQVVTHTHKALLRMVWGEDDSRWKDFIQTLSLENVQKIWTKFKATVNDVKEALLSAFNVDGLINTLQQAVKTLTRGFEELLSSITHIPFLENWLSVPKILNEDVKQPSKDLTELVHKQKTAEAQIRSTTQAMDEQKRRLVEFHHLLKKSILSFTMTNHERTPEHNQRVGGHPKSSHLGGWAKDFDLRAPGKSPEEVMKDVYKLEALAKKHGLQAFWKSYVGKDGIPDHVHVQIQAGANSIKEELTKEAKKTVQLLKELRKEIVKNEKQMGEELYQARKESFNKLQKQWQPYQQRIAGLDFIQPIKYTQGNPLEGTTNPNLQMGEDVMAWTDTQVPEGNEFEKVRELTTKYTTGAAKKFGLLLLDTVEQFFGQGLAQDFSKYQAEIKEYVKKITAPFDPHDVSNILAKNVERFAEIRAQEQVTPILNIEGRKDVSFAEARFKSVADTAQQLQLIYNKMKPSMEALREEFDKLRAKPLIKKEDQDRVTILVNELNKFAAVEQNLEFFKTQGPLYGKNLITERGIEEFHQINRAYTDSIANIQAMTEHTEQFGLAGQGVYDDLNEKVRVYRDTIVKLETLKKSGRLDIYPEMTPEQKEAIAKITAHLEKIKEQYQELQTQFNVGYIFDMLANNVNNAINQMVQGVLRGTRDVGSLLRDMVQNIIISFTSDALRQAVDTLLDMLKDIVLQAGIMKTFLSFFGISFGGGSSGESAPFADLFGRGIPGFRQHGGRVRRNKPYMVGEDGRPEMFVPDSSGTVIPNSQLGASAYNVNVGVKINVHNYGDDEVKVRQRTQGPGQQEQLDVIIGQSVARNIRRGGEAARSIQDVYRLRRAGGVRG